MSRVIEHKIHLVDLSPYTESRIDRGKFDGMRSATVSKPTRNFQQELGDEQTSGIESYERTLSYSPNELERKEFSGNTYSENRAFGRDSTGHVLSVKVDSATDSRLNQVAPVSPVRPIDSSYQNSNPFDHPFHTANFDEGIRNTSEHFLRPSPHLETQPLIIPRVNVNGSKKYTPIYRRSVDVGKMNQKDDRNAKPSETKQNAHFPTADDSFQSLNRLDSGLGSPVGSAGNCSSIPTFATLSSLGPMKKVTRKSRFVSIHDGHPVSPFVETVHYEPIFGALTQRQQSPWEDFWPSNDRQRGGRNQGEERRAHFVDESPNLSAAAERSRECEASDFEQPYNCFSQKPSTRNAHGNQHLDRTYDVPMSVDVVRNPLYIDQ